MCSISVVLGILLYFQGQHRKAFRGQCFILFSNYIVMSLKVITVKKDVIMTQCIYKNKYTY